MAAFVIIEDDFASAEIQKTLLEKEGHQVRVSLDAANAVDFVRQAKPDILIVDIMMPGMDGLEIVHRLRTNSDLHRMKIVVVSSKTYSSDRDRALAMGANGMLMKPLSPKTFAAEVMALAADNIDITYWGVRGTIPVPGRKTLRYGGNTSCITLELPRGEMLILDAGSGIRELSRHVMATRGGKLSAKLFITHPHWDHINALPFFVPLYVPGNQFEVMGPAQGTLTMREMIAAQMDGTYAPMTLRDLGALVLFRNLAEGEIVFGDIRVRTMLLSHPGNCLGYRISLGARSFCYITDNELYPRGSAGFDAGYVQKLTDFVKGADILLTDTTYTDAQYKNRVNWGHSAVSEVASLAHAAQVKELQIMHHDPEQTDDDIDRKLEDIKEALARLGSSVVCTAPVEGSRRRIAADGQLSDLAPIAA
jgi:phosphoribosyl 1,2-cyclic phosphodiesterase